MLHPVACAITTAVFLLGVAEGAARAADPTTADCLGASEASLRLGNDHRLRAERAQLLVCAAASCPSDIRKECLARVDDVNREIPTVVFSAKDGSGANLGAVRIVMDGEVLTERLEGTALSIDPGEHTFRFEAAGQTPVVRKLLIEQGQKDRREPIAFGVGAAPPPQASLRVTAPLTMTPVPPPAASAESSGLGAQNVLALAFGAVGVGGLAVGSVFGAMTLSKKNAAESVCSGSCTTQDGVSKWSDAVSTGNLSTMGFVIGGLGAAGAVLLWITAPSRTQTRVGLGPGGVQVRGAW
ncbi:MAG TPA: hypothetical protein VGL81_11195 [Polyangiaceae bacterium]|jgi:hypothetical protein